MLPESRPARGHDPIRPSVVSKNQADCVETRIGDADSLAHWFARIRACIMVTADRKALLCRRGSTIMSIGQPGSLYRRVCRWAGPRGGGIWAGRTESDRSPGICAGGSAEALHLRLLNRVRSSRRLEAETHRNIEVIWLLRP